jgi:hypothetical protein
MVHIFNTLLHIFNTFNVTTAIVVERSDKESPYVVSSPPSTGPAAMLPGGRNFGQKAQKGPGKIKLAGKICGQILAEFVGGRG